MGKNIDVTNAPGFWELMEYLGKAVAKPDRMSEDHVFTVTFDASPAGEDVGISHLELRKWEKE